MKKKDKEHLLFGSGKIFKENPLQFLVDTAKQNPNIATFRFGFQKMHLITNPAYIQQVLQKNYKNYRKGLKVRELKNFLGNGLAIAEGEDWRKKRKLSQPAFSKEKIEKMTNSIISCTNNHIKKWKTDYPNKELEMVTEIKELTLNIVGETLFSIDLSKNSKQLTRSITYLTNHTNSRIRKAFNYPIWFPFGGRRQFAKEKQYVDRFIYDIIKKRRNSKKQYWDLLSMLMDTYDENNDTKLTDTEIRDEIMTMFLSGSESTAISFTWIVYLLSKNKSIEDKLRNETTDILNKNELNLAHLPQLPYSISIIEETLRLYPPFWVIARQAINEDDIDGHKIKKGDGILISPYVMHHSENDWNDPEKFIPDRFSKINKENIKHNAYIPFGTGPRGCIGNHFALMEMQIMLTLIYQQFTFSYSGDGDLKMELGFNLRPKNGIKIKIIPLN